MKFILPTIAVVISFLALSLSFINFHWIYLKDRKVLNLVYVDKIGNYMQPEFAIVNGGKKDLLITNLECSFGNLEKDGHSTFPAQRIEFKESDSWLLPSGKGFRCNVRFTEEFTGSFAKSGKLETDNNKKRYMHDMYVDISWVEMDGKCYNKSIKLIKYGFNEQGKICYKAPVSYRKPINVYE